MPRSVAGLVQMAGADELHAEHPDHDDEHEHERAEIGRLRPVPKVRESRTVHEGTEIRMVHAHSSAAARDS
jgi:hypothetical protein